jgi:uncharacterized coiled-coil protein SlyX
MERMPQRRENSEETTEESAHFENDSTGATQEETLKGLNARLASLREILKKIPEDITDQEKEDVKELLPLAGRIRSLTKEVAKKKGGSN